MAADLELVGLNRMGLDNTHQMELRRHQMLDWDGVLVLLHRLTIVLDMLEQHGITFHMNKI
mgnify:CR=1 FL=1